MKVVLIVAIVLVVLVIAFALWKRQAAKQADALRDEAAEHRGDARATQVAATRQEAEADAMAAKAKQDLAIAEQQRRAAAVKREVADDLNVRADHIDPDVPPAMS